MVVSSEYPPSQNRKPSLGIHHSVLGMTIFIFTEVMFFASLISAYLVIRSNFPEWPPFGQPRLPASTTAVTTLFLILSGILLVMTYRKFKQGSDLLKAKKLLLASIVLGGVFVAVQGVEWIRLINFGLTLSSSTYGSLFYLIIGAHALHAFVAIGYLVKLFMQFQPAQDKLPTDSTFMAIQMFWLLVVGVWPFLYLTVYLM